MSFYDDKVLPHILDKLCSQNSVMSLRERVVPLARGVVLEVGIGSGINLQLCNATNVDFVWGLEPSNGMRRKAQHNINKSPVNVKWLDLPGEEIPLENNSVDTILLCFTLCSISNSTIALRQMHRVLKEDGILLFCEHGRSPEPDIAKWQQRVTPTWQKIAGGCHLNRPIQELISSSGFDVIELETCYMNGFPKIMGYMYIGQAKKMHK